MKLHDLIDYTPPKREVPCTTTGGGYLYTIYNPATQSVERVSIKDKDAHLGARGGE